MAVRTAVRAHVIAMQAGSGSASADKMTADARSYFILPADAGEALTRLIASGGLGGSGRTTIAEALAAHVGRRPVRDRRKRPHPQGDACGARDAAPDKAYRPDVSAKVYREMRWRTS